MLSKFKLNSINSIARMAGLFYLAHFITFFIADNGIHYTAVEPLDVTTIAQNMMSSENLFRIGFASFILAAIFFLLSAWALFELLKPVNSGMALLFVLLNLSGVAIQCGSLVFNFAAKLVLGGVDFLSVFPDDQLQALAFLFLNLYKHGFMIAQIFLALWVLPLGYLVYKSGYLPKFLGFFLMIDCVALLIWVTQYFLFFPGSEILRTISLSVSFITELSLCLWLVIKGVNSAATQ